MHSMCIHFIQGATISAFKQHRGGPVPAISPAAAEGSGRTRPGDLRFRPQWQRWRWRHAGGTNVTSCAADAAGCAGRISTAATGRPRRRRTPGHICIFDPGTGGGPPPAQLTPGRVTPETSLPERLLVSQMQREEGDAVPNDAASALKKCPRVTRELWDSGWWDVAEHNT